MDLAKVLIQHRHNIYLKIVMLISGVKTINILTVFKKKNKDSVKSFLKIDC